MRSLFLLHFQNVEKILHNLNLISFILISFKNFLWIGRIYSIKNLDFFCHTPSFLFAFNTAFPDLHDIFFEHIFDFGYIASVWTRFGPWNRSLLFGECPTNHQRMRGNFSSNFLLHHFHIILRVSHILLWVFVVIGSLHKLSVTDIDVFVLLLRLLSGISDSLNMDIPVAPTSWSNSATVRGDFVLSGDLIRTYFLTGQEEVSIAGLDPLPQTARVPGVFPGGLEADMLGPWELEQFYPRALFVMHYK